MDFCVFLPYTVSLKVYFDDTIQKNDVQHTDKWSVSYQSYQWENSNVFNKQHFQMSSGTKTKEAFLGHSTIFSQDDLVNGSSVLLQWGFFNL